MKYLNGFLRSWQSQTTSQAATLSVLIGTYTIVIITLLVHQNMEHLLSKWGSEVKLNVYLKDEVTPSSQQAIQKSIEDLNIFETVRFVSKETALVDFKRRMGSLAPSLIDDQAFENPLPSSFEAVLSPQQARTSIGELPKIAEKIFKMVGVEDISYGQGWIENYASVLKVFRISSTALVFVLAMGCLLVIGNSIKSSVVVRREEIEVMELFGATSRMILTPFLIEGALMGALGALGALVTSWLLYTWQSAVLIDSLGFWGLSDVLSFLQVWKVFLFLVVGSGLGAAGSYFCVRQISTGWAAAER